MLQRVSQFSLVKPFHIFYVRTKRYSTKISAWISLVISLKQDTIRQIVFSGKVVYTLILDYYIYESLLTFSRHSICNQTAFIEIRVGRFSFRKAGFGYTKYSFFIFCYLNRHWIAAEVLLRVTLKYALTIELNDLNSMVKILRSRFLEIEN